MKNIILGSIVLVTFSIAVIIFQMSCQRTAIAQNGNTYILPPATTSTLGGIIVGSGLSVSSNGTLSTLTNSGGVQQLNKILFAKHIYSSGECEIWIMNYDGTNAAKINIILPPGIFLSYIRPCLSPDGKKIIFQAYNSNGVTNLEDGDIYICNVDGTGVSKLYTFPTSIDHALIGGAY